MILHSYPYQRLMIFSRFWVSQLEMHPTRRAIPHKHRRDAFKLHEINMRRIGKKMAKKTSKNTPKFKWEGYVSVHIPESSVPAMEAFVTDEKNVYQLYNSMLTTDYQFKQYFDTYTDSIKTTIVCHNSDSENFGYAMSAYADNWYDSLAIAIFKHEVLTDRDWNSMAVKKVRKFG